MLRAAAREWDFTLRLANLREDFFRFSSLPLCIVETLACLPKIHLAQAGLRIFYRPQREVQPLARFTQAVELGVFGVDGGKPDCVHLRKLTSRFSLGNKNTPLSTIIFELSHSLRLRIDKRCEEPCYQIDCGCVSRSFFLLLNTRPLPRTMPRRSRKCWRLLRSTGSSMAPRSSPRMAKLFTKARLAKRISSGIFRTRPIRSFGWGQLPNSSRPP